MKSVHLQYFALLREHAGRSSETRATNAATLRDLYEELRAAHAFPLPAERVRAAVGETYAPLDTPLRDGMTVTFIPPVAGG